jgi:hypothetical protein
MNAADILSQAQAILNDSNIQFPTTLGPEIECFSFTAEKEPFAAVKLVETMGCVQKLMYGKKIRVDFGHNILELPILPLNSVHEFGKFINTIFTVIKNQNPNIKFLFAGDTPQTIFKISRKNRYNALIDGVCRESVRGKDILTNMCRHSAFQVNIGLGHWETFSIESKKLFYVLNNLGPSLAILFEELAGDFDSKRYKAFTFGEERRLPSYYFNWETVDRIEEFLLSIPQLIIEEPVKSNQWKVDGMLPKSLNAFHTSTIWHGVRFHGIDHKNKDKNGERLEFRLFNSMDPILMARAMVMIGEFTKYIVETPLQKIPILAQERWETIRTKKEGHRATIKMVRDVLSGIPIPYLQEILKRNMYQ